MRKGIYWFRNNLRLRDNPSLHKACQDLDMILYIFIWPEWMDGKHELGFPLTGDHRKSFTEQSVLSLKKDLETRGAELQVLQGNPVSIIKSLSSRLDIHSLYTSNDPGEYERAEILSLSENTEVIAFDDNALLRISDLPFALENTPEVFTSFRKSVEGKVRVRDIQDLPDIKPSLPIGPPSMQTYKFTGEKYQPDHRSAFPFEPGEHCAWQRISHYFWETSNVKAYKETRNGLAGPEYSSKLSPFLATGAISPVSVYHELKYFELECGGNESTYWLIFEILWREYFRLISRKHGKSVFSIQGISGNLPKYLNDPQLFFHWANGTTGNDFVDANMRELNLTGYMSNRGRQNVASYLVHNMNLPWIWGAAYFESQLIDYDVSSNWCNWMYVSGVGNDPRSRVFNADRQASVYDAEGTFRKLWLGSAEAN